MSSLSEGLVRIKATYRGIHRRVTINGEGLDVEFFRVVVARLFEVKDRAPLVYIKESDDELVQLCTDSQLEGLMTKAMGGGAPLRCYLGDADMDTAATTPKRLSVSSDMGCSSLLDESPLQQSIYLPWSATSHGDLAGGAADLAMTMDDLNTETSSATAFGEQRTSGGVWNSHETRVGDSGFLSAEDLCESEGGSDGEDDDEQVQPSGRCVPSEQFDCGAHTEDGEEHIVDGLFEELDQRSVVVSGNEYSRGLLLGGKLGKEMLELFAERRKLYDGRMRCWREMVDRCGQYIEMYAPMTYQEMIGTGVGLDNLMTQPNIFFEKDEYVRNGLDVVMYLATEYEMSMDSTDAVRHCSSFSVAGDATKNKALLAGQNNDEDPQLWFGGEFDRIIIHHNTATNRTSGVYTHPGMMSYMGMNSEGLTVCWTYVDNGERNMDGVPTTVILRELLHKKTASEACEFLRICPRTVPNYYHICQSVCGDVTMLGIETSPSHFTVLSLDNGRMCHTNHFLFDQELEDNDIGILRPTTTTVARQKMFRRLLKEATGEITEDLASEMLSTAPIYNTHTLVSLIFRPERAEIRARFQSEEQFRIYNLEVIRNKILPFLYKDRRSGAKCENKSV